MLLNFFIATFVAVGFSSFDVDIFVVIFVFSNVVVSFVVVIIIVVVIVVRSL